MEDHAAVIRKTILDVWYAAPTLEHQRQAALDALGALVAERDTALAEASKWQQERQFEIELREDADAERDAALKERDEWREKFKRATQLRRATGDKPKDPDRMTVTIPEDAAQHTRSYVDGEGDTDA